MLRVLGRVTSINVRKVLWAADELGVAYEREEWGQPLRDPRDPEFVKLNPNATVPVIIDDGLVLWESNAIIRYLAARHRGLISTDIRVQALTDQWLTWQAGELNPQWGYAVNALMRRHASFTDAKRISESLGNWIRKLEVLESQIGRGPFIAGPQFSIADIAIALSSHRWFSTPVEKRPTFPAIADHYARMQARPIGSRYMTADLP